MEGLLNEKATAIILAVVLAQSILVHSDVGHDPPKTLDAPTPPSVNWVVEIADSQAYTGVHASLAIDSNDIPHIAHQGPGSSLSYTRKDNGTWSSEIVDNSDLVGEFPSISLDSGGRVHISYAPLEPMLWIPEDPPPPQAKDKSLRYAVRDNTGWTRMVVDDSVWAGFTSLALNSSGTPHISYTDWNKRGLYYAKLVDGAWKTALIDQDGGLESHICVDSKGNPHIVYARYGDPWKEVYYAKYSGGSWHTEHLGAGGYFIAHISMAMDDFDRPHVTWSGREGFKYAVWNGTWTVENATDGNAGVVAIALYDNSPGIHYSYYGRFFGLLDNSTWKWEKINTTEDAGSGHGANHPLAFDSRGNPHLAGWMRIDNKNHLAYLSREPLRPAARAGLDQIINESDVLLLDGSGSTGESLDYYWDTNAQVDSDGDGNYTNDVDLIGPAHSYVYGDDGEMTVTLRVEDRNGNWDTDSVTILVLNRDPDVSLDYACEDLGPIDIGIRVAGEKWHDVSLLVSSDSENIFSGTLLRQPGNPDEQMLRVEDLELDSIDSYSAFVSYSPEDDDVNGQPWGSTPAWMILLTDGKEIARLHHTFNVKHPETWNWSVFDLNSFILERECVLYADISDVGSDDLYVEWNLGDGSSEQHVFFNDGMNPDSYPSTEYNPICVTDTVKHIYQSAGIYSVQVTVQDDDGGTTQVSIVLAV
ncbi:MAG: PKD domain-containing protein [Candidatus Thorarchaeota archaeon]